MANEQQILDLTSEKKNHFSRMGISSPLGHIYWKGGRRAMGAPCFLNCLCARNRKKKIEVEMGHKMSLNLQ